MKEENMVSIENSDVVYFVSYHHAGGFGNAEVTLQSEIMDVDTIQEMAENIQENFELQNVIIINYVPLRLEPIQEDQRKEELKQESAFL